jgi:hypothetical protein
MRTPHFLSSPNDLDFTGTDCYEDVRCNNPEKVRCTPFLPWEVKGMFVRACLVVALVSASALGAEPVKSGPQTGQRVPGAFEPLNITGPDAGKKSCLFCRNGTNPVVMIFARDTSPELAELLQRVDAANIAHASDSMGSCAIFCTSEEVGGKLGQLARQCNLTNTILATCEAGGPARYKLAPEAEVTVLVYTNCVVKANHSFRKGELTHDGIDKILADLPLILSQN